MKMEKLRKFLFISLFVFCSNCFAQGVMLTHDATNWMTAVENLFATYDEINNSIKQIEQNYQKMQHAIEEAKSLDWENIQWDGDFDFRDELKQASTTVNKRLNYLRKAEDCFQKKTIKFGKQSFSFADMMSEQGFLSVNAAFAGSMDNSFNSACDAWTGKLTDKQKKAILRKYGVTPKNYYRIKAKEAVLKGEMSKIIGAAESELQNEEMRKNQEQLNAVMNKIMAGGTEKELAQYTSLLQKLVLERMDLMRQQQQEALAQQTIMDMAKSSGDEDKQTKKALVDSMTQDNKSNYEPNFIDEELQDDKKAEDKTKIPEF